MTAPTRRQRDRGWYGKYYVDDLVAQTGPEECFILDLTYDRHARPALGRYAAENGVSEAVLRGESGRYHVERVDGRSRHGQDRAGAEYVVLVLRAGPGQEPNPHARGILAIYADLCEREYPLLAADIRRKIESTT